jgi:hypothetical protein
MKLSSAGGASVLSHLQVKAADNDNHRNEAGNFTQKPETYRSHYDGNDSPHNTHEEVSKVFKNVLGEGAAAYSLNCPTTL